MKLVGPTRGHIRYVVVGTALLVLGYATLFLGEDAVDSLMGEDGAVEYLGAIGLIAASAFFFVAFLRARRGPAGWILKASLLVLALVFLFGAGEEVSWGQRIFGFGTPESVAEVNAQDETTVHNLEFLNGVLEIERLFQIFWFGFAVLIPVACALSARLQERLSRLIPIFPLWVAALLAIQQVIAEVAELAENADPAIYAGTYPFSSNRFELTETMVAVLFGIGAYAVARQFSTEPPEPGIDHVERPAAQVGAP